MNAKKQLIENIEQSIKNQEVNLLSDQIDSKLLLEGRKLMHGDMLKQANDRIQATNESIERGREILALLRKKLEMARRWNVDAQATEGS